MLNPYMHDNAAYIGTAEKVNRPSRTNEINALNTVLNPYGLKVDKVIEGISIVSFIVKINGSTPEKVRKLRYSVILDCDKKVTVKEKGAKLIIEMPIRKDDKRREVRLGNLYSNDFVNNGKFKPLMMIGMEQNGDCVYKDLSKCPHMLVSGTTGSGKSVFLHQVICSLLLNHNNDIEYYGIDTKRIELGKYRKLQNFHFIDEVETAISTLEDLCNEMECRYKTLDFAGVSDIDSYNRGYGKMNRIVVVIDEYADLARREYKRHVEDLVVRLAQKARACGIHLIVATQTPKADIISTDIKNNFPCRVALRVYDHNQSKVAIDETGAENLLGNGDMLFDPNNANIGIMHLQAAYVSPMEIENIVNMAYDIECRNRPIVRQEPKKKGVCNRIKGFFNRYAYNA